MGEYKNYRELKNGDVIKYGEKLLQIADNGEHELRPRPGKMPIEFSTYRAMRIADKTIDTYTFNLGTFEILQIEKECTMFGYFDGEYCFFVNMDTMEMFPVNMDDWDEAFFEIELEEGKMYNLLRHGEKWVGIEECE